MPRRVGVGQHERHSRYVRAKVDSPMEGLNLSDLEEIVVKARSMGLGKDSIVLVNQLVKSEIHNDFGNTEFYPQIIRVVEETTLSSRKPKEEPTDEHS